ncbi:MAG: TetR family transcriptional regulator C-terminal domain-containing protein [Sporomusaceae bacterium]|nr:TetR family transcriptional regulator C-terminal domain-containing protein [Sporomusaceae bacterium]
MKNVNRQKLIQIGAKAMLAKSYHAVGIQEILTEADIPKGSFYHYFSSKEDFGVAIISYYGQQLAALIEERLADEALSPRRRMQEYFLAIREYYAKLGYGQGCLVAKLATEVAGASACMRFALKREFDGWLRLFAACIRQAQQAGEIADGHVPEELAEFIYSSWEGVLIRMQVNHDVRPLDMFIHYVFHQLLPLRSPAGDESCDKP